jgi:hypothetical protein
MAIDTERKDVEEREPEATADGGLCRLDLPGLELPEDPELAEEEREAP